MPLAFFLVYEGVMVALFVFLSFEISALIAT